MTDQERADVEALLAWVLTGCEGPPAMGPTAAVRVERHTASCGGHPMCDGCAR